MNGERDFMEVIPDSMFSVFMNRLYNVWFRRWKNRMTEEANFEAALNELGVILSEGGKYPAVKHMCITLLYELEARLCGGYSETTRNKLLTLIGGKEGVRYID